MVWNCTLGLRALHYTDVQATDSAGYLHVWLTPAEQKQLQLANFL